MSQMLFSLAGFQVITIGRFWLIAEDLPPMHAIDAGRAASYVEPETRDSSGQ